MSKPENNGIKKEVRRVEGAVTPLASPGAQLTGSSVSEMDLGPWKNDNDHFIEEFEKPLSNRLRDNYRVDLNIVREPVKLADFGGLADQSVKTFGQTLFGTDGVQEKLAKYAENRFQSFCAAQKSNFTTHQQKENNKVPVLLSGIGTGKSTMLDNHLKALRANCKDPKLKALLEGSAPPLVLSATFSSASTFNRMERDYLPERMVALRLLCAYFGINWLDVRGSLLPSRFGVLKDTVTLIARHHKRTHGLSESESIAILINLDEINQITMVLDAQKMAEAKTAIAVPTPPQSTCQVLTESETIVRDIIVALRDLSMRGIDDCSPVFPLLAGTAHQHFVDSLRSSGVEYLPESMPTLSPEQVLKALSKSGVPEAYLQDREFLRLLDESGGVPRIIRKIIEMLTMEFDPSRIAEGRAEAIKYLLGKIKMSPSEVAGLLPAVLLGEPHSLSDTLPNSTLTYEQLQHSGVVWMEPLVGGAEFHVTMPLLSLRALCKGSTHRDTRDASKLLDTLDKTDWRKFEIFVARFSAYKMDCLARAGETSVSMGDFYGEVDMAPEVAELEVELHADKKYEIMPIATKRFPIDRAVVADKHSICIADKTFKSLTNGKVLVNAQCAAIDVVMVDPLVSGDGDHLVRAVCVDHSEKSLTLGVKKMDEDRIKALAAVKASTELSSATKCITVHITNRELDENFTECNPDSVVVSHRNLAAFFGPVLSRGLWSDTYWAKHSAVWTRKGSGTRQFSTTTQFPSKFAAGKMRVPAVVCLVVKILAK